MGNLEPVVKELLEIVRGEQEELRAELVAIRDCIARLETKSVGAEGQRALCQAMQERHISALTSRVATVEAGRKWGWDVFMKILIAAIGAIGVVLAAVFKVGG